ncbi:TPA: DUF1524 domain-containing protein, partial [Listeria monocytogenes]|nr:DUF1524 domain-containing protein [Listeria monocytogenes]HAK0966508.1 DUF1524 domain-containing protein [Listeria monocytogenes]HBM4206117.1 DUF1524 domain-containing protein [Listeria monocytogenes]HEM1121099.1 DUF1524 domain-containing protein [Listeria monocytogenes]HEM2508453.1 DUF1524 domain-containing protein [Listeria monocytogenes]
SEVQLTRKLLDYDEWNIDVIKERQVELAELAVNIWKV